jgi:tRNA(Arg) A34 adenosine deaminase TadA
MGSLGSRYNIKRDDLEVIGRILEEECGKLLKDFFKERRELK